MKLKLGLAEGGEVDSMWYMQWQLSAETNFKSRHTDGDVWWFVLLFLRAAIPGFVLFHVFKFMRRKIPRLLGYGPVRKNPNRRKFWRVVQI